jgi:Ser/Thr protein kinase RdoA (MazF antagonist)
VFALDVDALQALALTQWPALLGGSWREIRNGDECRVWSVEASSGAFIVRVNPAWRRRESLRWTHALAVHCRVTVPQVVAPLVLKNGATLFDLGPHVVSIYPRIAGGDLDRRDPRQRSEAARVLAAVHCATARWPLSHSRPPDGASAIASGADALAAVRDPELERWEASLSTRSLTRIPIHGDFYRRNVLAHGGEISGIIDWDEAHIDYAMAELAWAVWELCQTDHGDDLSEPQANDFVTAYSTAAPPLTAEDLRYATAFIRRRLRVEILFQLHARRRGDAWNDDNQAYFDAAVRAFHNLRVRVWRPL